MFPSFTIDVLLFALLVLEDGLVLQVVTSRVTSRQSLLLVRLSFLSLVFSSPVLKPNFHLKEIIYYD